MTRTEEMVELLFNLERCRLKLKNAEREAVYVGHDDAIVDAGDELHTAEQAILEYENVRGKL